MAATAVVSRAGVRTLVDLGRQATQARDRVGYTYLSRGEREAGTLTFAELDRRARAMAVALGRHASPGDRALLLFAPGLDFTAAFMGALYAGLVAVPAAPPDPRSGQDTSRLQAAASSARPAVVVTHGRAGEVAGLFDGARLPELPVVQTEAVAQGAEAEWRPPAIGTDDPAYLQYSSGSTASPRGVVITHGNALHGLHVINDAYDLTTADAGVLWLPHFHDMGLVSATLQSLYSLAPVWIMSPLAFLQRPVCWLAAISRHRATVSAGPDIAYALCARRVTEEQRAGLDLSCWRVAISGAEPVRADTIDAFAAAFRSCGFRREAFRPSYGLAEVVLMATGRRAGRPLTVLDADAAALHADRVVSAAGEARRRTLVGCGLPGAGMEVVVVDPASGETLAEDAVGEIWVAGPSVADSYWELPEQSAPTFGAACPGRGGRFLRTGDLGFLHGGELFVTGRLKDLIVVAGQNHYPEDIEATVQRSHPEIGRCAAFSIDDDAGERLVLLAELGQLARQTPDEIGMTARQAVAQHHGLTLGEWVEVPPGSLPVTTSGKIRRHACRDRYLAGELGR